jgi:hypothetical protein
MFKLLKVLNDILLTLASDHDKQKTKPSYNFIMKLACLMQHRGKYEAKIVMKVRVLHRYRYSDSPKRFSSSPNRCSGSPNRCSGSPNRGFKINQNFRRAKRP